MIRSAVAIACLAACAAAFAQDAYDEKYLGAGARLRPAYDGADGSRVDAIPYVRLYGEHFFARTTQNMLEGGWRTRPFGGIVLGAQAAYEEGRFTGDSAFLEAHRFEDIDPSASVGLHAEGDWQLGPVPVNALLRYRHDVNPDNGTQLDLRSTVGVLDWRGIRAGLFGQVTWGDGKSTMRYYGIAPAQSAASGLPAYQTGSGIRYVQAGMLGDFYIARHWIGLWGLTWQRLQDDAAESPLTRDRSNWYANAGVAYRF
ncbi:MAG TPA: MipA/OmpV family protein [Burkholderiales bacterium]|nr:MipA/OmpV family protein [Burkholderiales bacterium]